MHSTKTRTSTRQNESAAHQNVSSTDNAVAISPPDYGIDFIDSQRTEPQGGAIQLISQPPLQRIGLQSLSEGTDSSRTPINTENKTSELIPENSPLIRQKGNSIKIARNRGDVKWGKRQSQTMRNAVFSPSLKGISYP